MTSRPRLNRSIVLRVVAIPAIVAGYVFVMGSTGACPLCSTIVSGCGFTQTAAAQEPPATKPADAPKPDTKPETKPETKPAPAPETKPAEAPAKGPMHEALFKDFDGKSKDLADAAGKPIIIELWATWCGPCRRQREVMHDLSAKHPEVVFVAASVDEKGPSVVRSFLAQNKSPKGSNVLEFMSTPALQARIAKFNNSNSIPKIAYVNKKGQIIDVSIGTQTPAFMEAMIKNLSK